MSATTRPKRTNAAVAGAGLLMVLCCAIGPAIVGSVAGAAIGGWLGVACAAIVAAVVGLLLFRHNRRRGRDC